MHASPIHRPAHHAADFARINRAQIARDHSINAGATLALMLVMIAGGWIIADRALSAALDSPATVAAR